MFPYHLFKKLWLFVSVVSAVLVLSCHTVKQEKPGMIPVAADGQAITSTGENYEGVFSPDGQKIAYISSGRPQHNHPQVYEMDLKTRKEKRITFQGAPIHEPQYSPKGDAILYSSPTDELKEDPPIFHVKKDETFKGPSVYLEPNELYLHSLNKFQIERLTKRLGFDGEAKFVSPSAIVFTRRTDDKLTLMETTLRGHSAWPWKNAGARAAQFAVGPKGQRFAWIEYSEDFQISDLKTKIGKETKSILYQISALKKNPVWSPDGKTLLFTMNYPDKTKSEIYAVKDDGTCLTALTKNRAASETPAISPAGDAFMFTSNQSGSRQLYLKTFPKTLDCPLPAKAQ